MEYLIAIGITALFFILFMATRKKVAIRYYDFYSDEEYFPHAKQYVRELPYVTRGGSIQAKRYISTIKRIDRILKDKLPKDVYEKLDKYNDMKSFFLNENYDTLSELPSINGEARVVKLARFCLAHSDYQFNEERCVTLIDEHNKFKTLSFDEVLNFKKAYAYVLLEELAFVYLQMETVLKVQNLAEKYIDNPDIFNGKYTTFTKSRLFLSICADKIGYKSSGLYDCYAKLKEEFSDKFKIIFYALNKVRAFDFSRYYTPLEILDEYSSFKGSDIDAKAAFCSLLQRISDKENLDEFMLAIRLNKYMKTASAGHVDKKRFSFFNKSFIVIVGGNDITKLALALSSSHYMNLIFGKINNYKSKKRKSITNIVDYENTFEPIYKYNHINFGVSFDGGYLSFSQNLPRDIIKADIVFKSLGENRTLHLVRGLKRQVYLGKTLITGLNQIKIDKAQNDITVVIPSVKEN